MKTKFKPLPYLITLILLLISTGFSSNSFVENIPADGDLRILHEKTFKISAGKNLIIETSSGDVTVLAWDKDEVFIRILGNDKAKKKVDFSFNSNENQVEIIAKKDGSIFNWFSSGIKLKFEVKIPSKFNNKISTAGGDIRFADVTGNNKLKTSGGDIWVKNTTGDLSLATSGGDINLDKTSGNQSVSTSGGDITARYFAGNLKASTSGGDIKLISSNAKINASTSGGDIDVEYSGSNNGVELTTSGGDITLKVPADFNAEARLYTSGGDIDCNLITNNVKKITSTKFEADLNSGGNPLICKTSGGDITVLKK